MKVYSLESIDEDVKYIKPKLLKSWKPHNVPVIAAVIDPDDSLVATGAADGTIKVWDIRGGYLTHNFPGHSGLVSVLHFFQVSSQHSDWKVNSRTSRSLEQHQQQSQNERGSLRLASGGEDGKVRVWQLDRRKAIATLDAHASVVRGLAYSEDKNILFSASRDKTAVLWEISEKKARKIVPVLETIETLGLLPESDLFFVGGDRGRIRLFSMSNGREYTEDQTSLGEASSINHAVYNARNQYIVSVHTDQTLLFHSISSLSKRTPDSNRASPLPVIRRITGTYDEVIDLAFVTPDKSLLAVASNSESLRIVSLQGTETSSNKGVSAGYFGADVASLEGHSEIIICISVDASGYWLATGAKDNTARIWRIDQSTSTYEHWATFTGHAESIGAIALPQVPIAGSAASEGKLSEVPPSLLLTGSNDRTIKRWVVPKSLTAAAKALYTRKAHEKDINAIAISPMTHLFASASQDRTIKIWSTEEGETQGILRGHKRGVWSVVFAPKDAASVSDESGMAASSGRGLLLSGSGDKTLKLWSLNDYSCIRTFEGHTNNALKVLWLPPTQLSGDADTRSAQHAQQATIASAGADGLVKIWSPYSGECLATLDNHTDRVWALAYNAATRSLVSGGGDSIVTFWKDTSEETAVELNKAAGERVEQDQDLRNFEREGNWREGIVLALQLNHPNRLLGIFTKVVNTTPREEGSLSGVKAVDEVISELADEQLLILLMRLRDWNTNARTAPVAQRMLNVVVRKYSPERLAGLAKRRGGTEVIEALKAYTERHYKRMEELWGESWIVEFLLGEMEQLDMNVDTAIDSDPIARNKDVVMV